MVFFSSAPCKAILFGEHYVVYGSPALSIAIEPRNKIRFSAGQEGILLSSSLGEGRISSSGEYTGPEALAPYAEVARKVFGSQRIPGCTAKFYPAWQTKGVGVSASFCAAFAAGLYRLKGQEAEPKKVFEAAQAGDLLAHGGRASGIDAKTVSFGKPIIFERRFSPPGFFSTFADFSLPYGSSLLLIDTGQGKKESTSAMVKKFAEQFGIACTPAEAREEQREAVRKEYEPLWKKIVQAIKSPDAEAIGELMIQNHKLLSERKMSSPGIERAVEEALSLGAYGAKLTGAGGEGGAAIALFEKRKAEFAAREIQRKTGFACYKIALSSKGAA